MTRQRAGSSLRHRVIARCQELWTRGWVANHDGNITARLGGNRFLATPTAMSKVDVTPDQLIEVDAAGTRVRGVAKAFSELNLHLAVYEAREDVAAVVHAHPPHATAVACSGSRVLERPFIAEAVVSLGDTIPTIPYAMPGADARAVLLANIGLCNTVLLANHGVVAWGADLEQAMLRLELVEHLARIAAIAQSFGGVCPLPDADVRQLAKRSVVRPR